LYVGIARSLASIGWTTVRFDHSGIGDSPVRRDGMPFERSAILEAREVMDWCQQMRGVDRFVLVGLCSGAVTAFEVAVVDPRVVGTVMINPQGFDDGAAWNTFVQNRGHARRYWTRSLFSMASWRKALTGRVDYGRLLTVLWRQVAGVEASEDRTVKSIATRVASDLHKVLARGARILLLCSEGDDGIDYMNVILGRDIRTMSGTLRPDVRILPHADHSFTLSESQRRVVEAVQAWALERFPPSARLAESTFAFDGSAPPNATVSA
jgi:pimeloyl-ACP methyl ester carboxylesterase